MMTSAHEILLKYWGYEQFRPQQEVIIESVIAGRDTVALLPTGGGKSLCFQLPALAMDGLCVVISPLVALMRDQVNQLRDRGIKALHLAGGLKQEEVVTLLDNATFGNYKFLYLSPERLQQEYVQEAIRKMAVCLIAVDEMHCISQWGNDFRPAYKKIAILRSLHPLTPVIGLTATATQRVLADSIQQLELEEPNVFRQSFDRPNLTYDVIYCEDKAYELEKLLGANPGACIIYVRSRGATLETVRKLKARGFQAAAFHGGMPPREKKEVAEAWSLGDIPIMVATNAFGMGIDKSNVRLVVHTQLPDSLESYFQEAGRAGRDGEPARAILQYHKHDREQVRRQFVYALPDTKTLIKVYRNLANYFQVPYGEGAQSSFPFDFAHFCGVYGLSATLTYNSLTTLDRLGIVQLSQQFGRKSTVQFKVTSNQLLAFFKRNPGTTLVGKTLLRIYGGIFELPTPVNVELLAKKTGKQPEQVVAVLKMFEREDLAQVTLAQTDAQITFLVPREDERTINPHSHELSSLNEQKKQRVQAVIDYAQNDQLCRSVQLLSYFGETSAKPCGNCRVCVKAKSAERVSVRELGEQLMDCLKQGAMDSRQLERELGWPAEQLLGTLQALLESGKIVISEMNTYKLRQ